MKERRNIERRKYGRKVTYPFIDSDGVLVTKNRRRLVDRRLSNEDTRNSDSDNSDASGMQSLDITDSKVMELEDALKEDQGPASKIEEAIKEIESQIIEETSFESAAKTRREIKSTKANQEETEVAVPDIEVEDLPEENSTTSIEVSYRGNTKVFTEEHNVCQVGRDPTCDIVVQGKFVSRAHAKIKFKGGKILLEDNSFNGTYIRFENGQKIHISNDEQTLISDGTMSMGEPVKDNSKYNIEFRILS